MQSLAAFLLFFGDKKKLLKALLTCTFIPSLLNSFDLLQFIIEEKIHTKVVADVSISAGGGFY